MRVLEAAVGARRAVAPAKLAGHQHPLAILRLRRVGLTVQSLGRWTAAAAGPAANLALSPPGCLQVNPLAKPPIARRNFTAFAALFCRSMQRLGADDCE